MPAILRRLKIRMSRYNGTWHWEIFLAGKGSDPETVLSKGKDGAFLVAAGQAQAAWQLHLSSKT